MTQKTPTSDYSPKRSRFNISKICKYSSLELIPQELVQYPRQPHHFVPKDILTHSRHHLPQQDPKKRYPERLAPLLNPQNHSKDFHHAKGKSLIFPYKCRVESNDMVSWIQTDAKRLKLIRMNAMAGIVKKRQANGGAMQNKNKMEEKEREYFAELKVRLKRERNYLIKIESKPLQKHFETLVEMSLRKRSKTQIRKND